MTEHTIGTRQDWTEARIRLLEREKELTRLRDEVALERQGLPWVPVGEQYVFDTEHGSKTLADLFAGRSQLLVYHFMFGPDWSEGCPSCSFWADSFDGVLVHLAQRGVTMVCASRAPLDLLLSYRRRMGWSFPWVSSLGNEFNFDYGVSFTATQRDEGGTYNFRHIAKPYDEMPGLSAFALEDDVVYHTYSCYARGVDTFNSAYQLLDLAPKGRDEGGLPWPMAWVRRHDSYEVVPAGAT